MLIQNSIIGPNVSIEEGVINGGFGDGVCSWLLENGYKGKIKRLGLPDSFVQHGSRDEILKYLGLDKNGIVENVQKFLNIKNKSVII